MALPTSKQKMWELFNNPKALGVRGKDIFYNIIEELESRVIKDIETQT